jgi:hypothetical protein
MVFARYGTSIVDDHRQVKRINEAITGKTSEEFRAE